MAPPARLELTTLRLGGVRSIQVSYGGIFNTDCNEKKKICQHDTAHFLPSLPYTIKNGKKEGNRMRETDDRTADIEDLLYDEDGGYPSER